MASPSDPPERPRSTLGADLRDLWDRSSLEAILLVLLGVVAGVAIGLVFSSEAAIGAPILGGVLVAVGSYFTIKVTRDGQVTDRFTRAIQQLGSDKLAIRLGAIYALERIALDAPDTHHGSVMQLLPAYVREQAPWPPAQAPWPPAHPERTVSAGKLRPATDVQAALTVLGRRNPRRDYPGTQLRLSDVDLRGANLREGRFEGARLRRTNLERAHLEGARLEGAELRSAHLGGADLEPDRILRIDGAHLEGAHLEGTDLRGAKLKGASYDSLTTWPGGFDPDARGCVRVKAPPQE